MAERGIEPTRLQRRASIGRSFEHAMRQEWHGTQSQGMRFDRYLSSSNRRTGRPDLLIDEGGWYSVIEFKASDWDAMAEHRVRPNVHRHVRQVLKYVEHFWDQGLDVCPALIFPKAPVSRVRKDAIESILEERCVQVRWLAE